MISSKASHDQISRDYALKKLINWKNQIWKKGNTRHNTMESRFDDATAQCRFATISLSLHRHAMIGFEICYGLIAVKHGNQLSNRFETIS